MADEKDQPKQARSASALNELMEGAKALQAIQAQAAQDAMRLPEPRLDEAQEGHYFLASDGETKIDANGNPVKAKD